MEIKDYEHKTQYYETDQMGVIHHSNYIRFMEEARVDLMQQLGIGMVQMESLGIIIPVLTVSCEYKRMTRFDEKVTIRLRAKSYNGIKLFLDYTIKNSANGELKAIGSSSHGFITRDGRPISLKKSYPEIHKVFEDFAQMEQAD
jgi:acyl-CoA thioester hydrolase